MSDSCNPMDHSLLGSSVNGILQERILEWVAISISRGSFQPRNQTQVSCIAGRLRFLTYWATREVLPHPHKNVCMCITESLCWTAEISTLEINYISIFLNVKNKWLKSRSWKHSCTPIFTAALFAILNDDTETTEMSMDRWIDTENVV